MKIVADANIPFVEQYFGSHGELILKPGRSISHKDLLDVDILLVRSITLVNKELLQNTPVKFVGSITAGADHLDIAWLNEAGITWSVATGFNALPVADYIVSTIAGLQKKGLLHQSHLKAAVIGVGNVGKLVVERLKFLNFDVIMCDPFRAENEKEFKSVFIDQISDVDLISLHVPLTFSGSYPTYHFINKNFLERQRPHSVLINTSRGSIIHSEQLLNDGQHLHWCFDVWEHEPHINKIILEQALIATPHIAGYSKQSKIRGIDMIYRIACEKKFINPTSLPPINMPYQKLAFSGTHHSWQEIVLGVFNPFIITSMMRTKLISDSESAIAFDEMRNALTYRYEFGFTEIDAEQLNQANIEILNNLSFIQK